MKTQTDKTAFIFGTACIGMLYIYCLFQGTYLQFYFFPKSNTGFIVSAGINLLLCAVLTGVFIAIMKYFYGLFTKSRLSLLIEVLIILLSICFYFIAYYVLWPSTTSQGINNSGSPMSINFKF